MSLITLVEILVHLYFLYFLKQLY